MLFHDFLGGNPRYSKSEKEIKSLLLSHKNGFHLDDVIRLYIKFVRIFLCLSFGNKSL